MNKIVNINLGGYPFTIDENAYDRLRTYLQSIHKHFRQTEGYEEITTDIEARLAELLRDRLGNRPIVNLKDVEEALRVGNITRIMFDNFEIPILAEAVAMVGDLFETEASGGINLYNVRKYAQTGVNFISAGALTHSAQPLDLSLKIA